MSYLLQTVKIDRYRLGLFECGHPTKRCSRCSAVHEGIQRWALVFLPGSGSRSRAIVFRTICRLAPIGFALQGNHITGAAG